MSLPSNRKSRKVLVFQHVPFEPLGTLDPLLKDAGFRIRYVNFGRDPGTRPDIRGYAGIIVLGGPMNVDEVDIYPNLATEVQLLREAIQLDMPVLGICLGAQLLAKALDAKVSANPKKEIGWYPVTTTAMGREDPLLQTFGSHQTIFQWHGDTFDLPDGAVHLASSEACKNQAFRFGNCAYGFQFHLEVDEALINRWLRVPINVAELEALAGSIDPGEIRVATKANIDHSKKLSEQTFGEFLNLFGSRRRRRMLASR